MKTCDPIATASVRDPFAYAEDTEAGHFGWWCEAFLQHSVDRWAGQPMLLEPWQQGFFNEALAVDPERAGPYWRSVALVVPRKNGKTAMLAALALYRLLEDDGQPEILLAAASDKQAGRLFDAVVSYLRRNPDLDARVHRREYVGEIVNVETGGKIIRLPSSGETLDGFNPSLAICDELHAWTTPTRKRVWTSLTTGGGARESTQVVTITTAGDAASRAESILGRLLDANEQQGELEQRPGLTVSRNHDGRTIAFNYSAPTVDPRDVAAMKLANPASWITDEFLARQAANPELTDSEVLQLHGCVWAEGFDAWITPDQWNGCHDPDATIPVGADVVLGVDVGLVHDSTAVAVSWWDGDRERVVVEAKVWSAAGALADVQVPGGRIDLSDIEQHIRNLAGRHTITEVAYDPRFFERSAQMLSGEGLAMVALEQSSASMADAYQDWFQAVLETKVAHAGGRVLTAHVMGTAAEKTDRGWKIRKLRQAQRIDALVACVMAHYRCRAQVGGEILVAWG